MTIKELNIYHFGKFHHKKIELRPGFNIVYGENEAGKSTIHAFIQCMLFGAKRRRGRGAGGDMYSHYQPWMEGRNYEGSMVIHYGGHDYRLYRSFCKEDEKFQVFHQESGREIELPNGEIGDLIEGLTESSYKNTISVRQQESRLDEQFSTSLQNYIANLGLTKSDEIHIDEALKALKNRSRALSTEPLKQQEEQLYQQLEQLEAGRKKEAGLRQNLRAAEECEKELNRQLETTAKTASLRNDEAYREYLEGVRILEKYRVVESNYRDKRILSEQQRLPEPISDSSGSKTAAIVSLILFGTAFASRWLIDMPQLLWGIIFAASAVFLGWNVLRMVFAVLHQRDDTAGITSEQEFLERELDNLAEQLAVLKKQLKPYQTRFGMDMAMPQSRMKTETDNQLKKQLAEAVKRRQRLEWELEQYLDNEASMLSLQEQLLTVKDEAGRLEIENRAVELAAETIKALSQEIHHSFGKQLNHSVEDIFRQISGTENKQIYINEDFNILIDNSKTYVNIDKLSAGAIDQLYFALRFSVGEILFADREMPMLLDDSFSLYDDRRLKNIIHWLVQRRCSQLLIFTCHHREADTLDDLGYDYNYVGLFEE